MWVATITSVTRNGRNVVVAASFEQDGVTFQTSTQGDNLTAELVAKWCKDVIASHDASEAAFAEMKALEGRVVTLPTDSDVEASAFFELRARAMKLSQAIQDGLSKDQQGLDAMNVQLKADFKPEYIDDFRWR